jgi:4-amino-4-deoxy-L-arabinose transferase-like glycosyltransferase
MGGPEKISLSEEMEGVSLSAVRRFVVAAILTLAFLFYLHNINRWFMEDDEGSYLYAAWRVSEGEMPYRDFLTPQLPLFLYLGAGLMRLSGGSTFFLRSSSAMLVVVAALFVHLAAEKTVGYGAALLSMVLFLIHPDVCWAARFYRPEAYMLLFGTIATYVFVVSYLVGRGLGFLAAGALFALATLCKLFGLLPLAGCVLFTIYKMVMSRTRIKQKLTILFGSTVTCVVIVGVVLGAFYFLPPNLFEVILGHHLMQGRELTRLQIFGKGLHFYLDYFRRYPLLLLLTAFGIVESLKAKPEQGNRRLHAIFTMQIPTALAFLVLSRELYPRHLVYLVPALCTLCASSLELLLSWRQKPAILWEGSGLWRFDKLSTGKRILHAMALSLSDVRVRALLLLLALAGLLIRWTQNDLEVLSWSESDTWHLAEYIAANTQQDDYVLADYPRLNFYAQRKTTYSGAGLSCGAAQSGQITGRQLIKEIEENQVKMILIQTKGGWPHPCNLVKLKDYGDFREYVSSHFHLVGGFHRGGQMFDVYHVEDLTPIIPLNVNFDGKLILTGYGFESPTVEAAGDLPIVLGWESQRGMEKGYHLFIHLVDERGHLWGQKSIEIQNALTFLTSYWDAGEANEEGYVVPVMAGTPPGRYQVRIGLFELSTGERLDILDENLAPAGTTYTLGEVRVTSPTIPPSLQELSIQHPLRQEFGDQMELLGYAIGTDSIKSGDTIGLTLFWRGLEAMDVDYYVLLQLQSEDGRIWAQEEEHICSHPTSQWRPGEVIRAQYDLGIEPAAPAGDYQLSVNLLESDTRQQVLRSCLPLAKIRVMAPERQFALPENIKHPTRANLGDQVVFLGYDLNRTTVKPGETLHLTLYWQAQKQMETSYKVFTHLLDAQNRIWGQRDSVPMEGTYPTTSWLPDEVVIDEYEILVNATAPAGEYQIEVGMYDPKSMQRLLAFDEQGIRLPSDRILLSKVRVD